MRGRSSASQYAPTIGGHPDFDPPLLPRWGFPASRIPQFEEDFDELMAPQFGCSGGSFRELRRRLPER